MGSGSGSGSRVSLASTERFLVVWLRLCRSFSRHSLQVTWGLRWLQVLELLNCSLAAGLVNVSQENKDFGGTKESSSDDQSREMNNEINCIGDQEAVRYLLFVD